MSGGRQWGYRLHLQKEIPCPASGDELQGRSAIMEKATSIYTVPAGRPFLRSVAAAVLSGRLPASGVPRGALDLPRCTILLPTRRSVRAMQDAFLAESGGKALLLPRLAAVGDSDEAEGILLGGGAIPVAPVATVSPTERLLVLTELVLKWSAALRHSGGDDAGTPGARTPAHAAAMAQELASLMDMLETEQVDPARLQDLVPEEHAEHWHATLRFLEIVLTMWPAFLAERGAVSPAQRRNMVLQAEARRFREMPPAGPVIVAGVTGSIPASAELIRAVAGLPEGVVVLPSLDTELDEDTFATLASAHPEHPQSSLARLLASIGVYRSAVRAIPGADTSERLQTRTRIVSEAMRPAPTIGRWREAAAAHVPQQLRSAFDGVFRIDAPSEHGEAEVIALILREALEVPGRTAALVSRDRELARRVSIRLASMGIVVDDSAGRPFGKTPPGVLLDLVIEAVSSGFSPTATMALLKHPLTRLGLDVAMVRRAARNLELTAFRGIYLGRGIDGIDEAVERVAQAHPGEERRHPAVRRMRPGDWQFVRALVGALRTAFAPLIDLYAAGGEPSLRSLIETHLAVAEMVTLTPEGEVAPGRSLWQGEAGEAAQRLFASLLEPGLHPIALAPADYADFYRALVAGATVRPQRAVHPRLAIWGPFEARLQQPDIVVLGSLNEGTWPERVDPGPWLNRAMRARLGLPSPEDAVGRAAHDFTSLLAAERVYLTRATKIGGVPQVPSRWLMRFDAFQAGIGAADAIASGDRWLSWAQWRDAAPRAPAVLAPSPRPALALRPRRLSVTDVERWIANPYAIFARHVAGLVPLDPLGREPDASMRGQIAHAALGRFANRFPDRLPGNIVEELMRDAEAVVGRHALHPRVAAFWMPRLRRFAEWFAQTEPTRRGDVEKVVAESSGAMVLAAPAGPFSLTARADRIDISASRIAIYDYKTGAAPSSDAALEGRSPQLPLEAAIVAAGGFAAVPSQLPAVLSYVLVGGGEPPGEEKPLSVPDMASLVADATARLSGLIAEFDDPATPYPALRRAAFQAHYAYDPYEHLARVAEWSTETQGGDA